MKSRRRITTWLVTVLAMCLGALTAGVTAYADEVLDDLAGRIEYAFYAADSRSLQQSWQQLDKLQVDATDSELRDSYLNYGRWKAAQLLAVNSPEQAQQFAQDCAESETIKSTSQNAVMLAGQHALVAACYGLLETLRPVRRVLYRRDREAALQRAMQAHSRSPQVLFIAASLELQQGSADKRHGLLTQALKSFEAGSGTTRSATANWGYAETCYLLGKLELARGNMLAARNALEQALVQAPDYRDAQQLLRSLSVK